MLPSRTRVFVATFLLLAALGADSGRDGDGDGGKARTDVRTVSGTISALAWSEAKLTVDAPDGHVTLKIDRNTAVFLENRLGSTGDLVVGAPVRASFGGDKRAVWVEVRSRSAAPATGRDGGLEPVDGGTPAAGARAGPPVLPGLSGDAGVADAGTPTGAAAPPPAGDAGTPPPPSGNVPAGPSPPEPNAGVAPPRPPEPGPSGPGPVPGGAR